MAELLPVHLPAFAFDASPAGLRLMPRPQHRLSSSTIASLTNEQRLRKRRSLLDITLDHVLPSRSSATKTTSEHRYTTSRYSNSTDGSAQRYRCDIMAVSSSDFASADSECRQLVIEAGGTIVEQQYPGGFLFDIISIEVLPIETGDKTVGGGSIVVEAVDTLLHEQCLDMPVHATGGASKWTIKSGHRLHRRPRDGRISPFQELRDSREPLFSFRKERRVTLMEMLIEGLEEQRRLESDADWVTLDGITDQ